MIFTRIWHMHPYTAYAPPYRICTMQWADRLHTTYSFLAHMLKGYYLGLQLLPSVLVPKWDI